MKKIFLLLFFATFSPRSFCQLSTFLYKIEAKTTILRSDSATITFSNYTKKEGHKVREVRINDRLYTMTIENARAGKIQTIRDENGTAIGTVFLGSLHHNNIVLSDGRDVHWKELKSGAWAYTIGEKEVARCSYKKEGPNRKLIFEKPGNEVISPALLLTCLERGQEKLSKSTLWMPVVACGAVIGILRYATYTHDTNL